MELGGLSDGHFPFSEFLSDSHRKHMETKKILIGKKMIMMELIEWAQGRAVREIVVDEQPEPSKKTARIFRWDRKTGQIERWHGGEKAERGERKRQQISELGYLEKV
jgi:hypothetical protein